jgi:hypothetical protein
MQALTNTRNAEHTIGELCVGGDWACAHGDLSALRHISLQLAAQVAEPLHCALTEIADVCYSAPDLAVELWNRLKDRIYRRAGA